MTALYKKSRNATANLFAERNISQNQKTDQIQSKSTSANRADFAAASGCLVNTLNSLHREPSKDAASARITIKNQGRNERYKLRKTAAEIVGGRVAKCMCCVTDDDVKLFLGKTATFAGVTVCGSAWTCAICEARIVEERKKEIAAVFKQQLQGAGTKTHKAIMITFTLPHGFKDQLSQTLCVLKTASDKFRSGKSWNLFAAKLTFFGAITATEIMYSNTNGWHPHLHCIYFLETKITVDRKLKAAFFKKWLAALKLAGFVVRDWRQLLQMRRRSIDIHDNAKAGDYLAKSGAGGWGADAELTKNSAKTGKKKNSLNPFGLLTKIQDATDENERKKYTALFAEYAKETKGRKRIRIDSNLKKLANVEEKSDEDLARKLQDDMSILLGKIDRYTFKNMIVKHDLHHAVLAAAESGGALEVQEILGDGFTISNQNSTKKDYATDLKTRRAAAREMKKQLEKAQQSTEIKAKNEILDIDIGGAIDTSTA